MIVEQLQGTFRGSIFGAGDDGYDTVRRVYNAMIDKRPRVIARCADVADVIAAVRYGRENNLLTAIRGGGHNGGGLGTCQDGLVIDLSAMRGFASIPTHARCGCRPDA
jgi:FAD/FMN-containing dehydrogenase